MTSFTNQAELERLSETELHLRLRQIFNAMVRFEKASPEYSQAAGSLEDVKKALRRRTHSPKP
jgi:hypothetical protein